jgi:hypothetical protein
VRNPQLPLKRRGGWSAHVSWTHDLPIVPSEFDLLLNRLHLTQTQLHTSVEFRSWLKQNYQRRFVPEAVLESFGLTVF